MQLILPFLIIAFVEAGSFASIAFPNVTLSSPLKVKKLSSIVETSLCLNLIETHD